MFSLERSSLQASWSVCASVLICLGWKSWAGKTNNSALSSTPWGVAIVTPRLQRQMAALFSLLTSTMKNCKFFFLFQLSSSAVHWLPYVCFYVEKSVCVAFAVPSFFHLDVFPESERILSTEKMLSESSMLNKRRGRLAAHGLLKNATQIRVCMLHICLMASADSSNSRNTCSEVQN